MPTRATRWAAFTGCAKATGDGSPLVTRVMELLGLVELKHNARNNRARVV